MSKKYHILLTAIFCGFLGLMLAASILLPDKEFSELENRNLSKPPKLTVEALMDGDFMEDAEDYTADHVALRDVWVAMKAWCERLSGKQENNGVYFGAGETLLNHMEDPDPDKAIQSVGHVNKLVENVSVPVYFGLIPSSAEVWKDRLPQGAPTADESGWIDVLYSNAQAITLDMESALKAHGDEEIYYRTDHHWSSLGAGYGANVLLEAMGLEPVDLASYEKTTVSEEFYGTTFSSSGVRWVKPDTIDIYIPEEGVEVTANFTGKPEPGQLYVEEYLDKKDKYSYFLGGNQPLCVLESEKNDGPKVLVIRDSYSDSMAPFLTERCSEVHLFDLRYNLTSIQQYVEEQGIDHVVVLYSFANFNQGTNLFALGR